MDFSQTYKLFKSSLEQASPDKLVQTFLEYSNGTLSVNNKNYQLEGDLYVLAFGKASQALYKGFVNKVKPKNIKSSLIITHLEHSEINEPNAKVMFSTHPYISDRSLEAGIKSLEFVKSCKKDDLLVVLVSGGGSAMLAYPIKEISLSEKQNFISELMVSGVPEREVNEIKKSLSQIKGGGLAEETGCNTIVNLILSDERNHHFEAISSGLTVCNKNVDPVEVVNKYKLWASIPDKIKNILKQYDKDTKKGCGKEIYNYLVGSRDDLISILKSEGLKNDFNSVTVLDNIFSSDVETSVSGLANDFRKCYEQSIPGTHLVVCTGEIQVAINKNKPESKGGRNQHLVATMMATQIFDFPFTFMAVASDGMDFIKGVWGAFYTDELRHSIESQNNELKMALQDTNSFKFHENNGTLILGDATGNNMSDFYLFAFQKV